MPSPNDWAPHPLVFEDRAFREMERGLTVRLIATPGPRTCQIADSIIAVLARRDISTFDYVPVMGGNPDILMAYDAVTENGSAASELRCRCA